MTRDRQYCKLCWYLWNMIKKEYFLIFIIATVDCLIENKWVNEMWGGPNQNLFIISSTTRSSTCKWRETCYISPQAYHELSKIVLLGQGSLQNGLQTVRQLELIANNCYRGNRWNCVTRTHRNAVSYLYHWCSGIHRELDIAIAVTSPHSGGAENFITWG